MLRQSQKHHGCWPIEGASPILLKREQRQMPRNLDVACNAVQPCRQPGPESARQYNRFHQPYCPARMEASMAANRSGPK